MGCGCGKKARLAPAGAAAQGGAEPPAGAARVAVYEVVVGGEVVTSTKSGPAARSEARRLGGTLRVTSVEATPQEAALVGGPPGG